MLRTLNQILIAGLLACCVGLLVALTPTPFQPYPIQSCNNPGATYAPEKNKSAVVIVVAEIACGVHRYREDISAFSALTIAIFTIVLVVFNGRLATSTRIAADAAKKAADALPALERAHIFVEPTIAMRESFYDHDIRDKPDTEVLWHSGASTAEYRIVNYGKTPAILKSLDVRITHHKGAPDNRAHLRSRFLGGEKLINSGDGDSDEISIDYQWTVADSKLFISGKTWVWFYGSIRYDDIFGVEHFTYFRWRYGGTMRVQLTHGGVDYNQRT